MDPYTRKLEQENFALKAELEQYKEALRSVCYYMKILQEICPADLDNYDGDCSMCESKDIAECWIDHYLQQAKAGEANATTL